MPIIIIKCVAQAGAVAGSVAVVVAFVWLMLVLVL